MKTGISYLSVLAAMLCVALVFTCGCDRPSPAPAGSDEETPGEEAQEPTAEGIISFSDFRAKLTGGGENLEIPLGDTWVLPVTGFASGDEMTIRLRSDAGSSWTFECKEASDEEGATFEIPADFKYLGGMCDLLILADGGTINAEVFLQLVDNHAVERTPGYTTYGRVVDWDGQPVRGVAVSDGVLVTTTDDQGRYYLRSSREEGFVFISVPKNYRVAVKKTVPQFFQRLETSSSTYEMHNFVLEPQDNSTHRVIVFSDTHLANRTDDISQFETYFIPDMKSEISQAKSENMPLYGLALGDLAWDEWWYSNNYSLKEYAETISALDMAIYSIPGNHDNDPSIRGDFAASQAFRDYIGPTYYSVNIGDIHYIMMDDTIFNNSGATSSSYNVQDYDNGFTANQTTWLANDLATVPAGSTIVFGTHIQITNRPTVNNAFTYSLNEGSRSTLFSLLSGYDVHFVTGHTHTSYTNIISDNMVEHNIPAVCGTWWWTGYYSGNRCRINGDGTPSGYKVFEMEGRDMEWRYQALDRPKTYQFRAYDLRNCLMTRALYCPTSKTNVSDAWFSQYAFGWDKAENTSSTTKILVNVFDYDRNWKVEILENGNPLTVTRVERYDPLHVIHFNMARMNTGTLGTGNQGSQTFPTGQSTHFFEATASGTTSSIVIRVTDSSGKVYEETMTRPRSLYDMSRASTW